MTNTRFDDITSCGGYNHSYIAGLSDQELADKINELDCYEPSLMRDLCYRADMLDEYCDADGDTVFDICYAAAEKLGVEID